MTKITAQQIILSDNRSSFNTAQVLRLTEAQAVEVAALILATTTKKGNQTERQILQDAVLNHPFNKAQVAKRSIKNLKKMLARLDIKVATLLNIAA